MRGETFLSGTGTKFSALYRRVDPYYYSFGTPFLRRDNIRLEMKGEQQFWKNQLNAGITYRYDSDNIHELKEGTSVNYTYIFKAGFRKKKLPFITLTYSPSFQKFYSNTLKKEFTNVTQLYSIISGYTFHKRNTQTTLTGSYNKSFSYSSEKELQPYHIDMAMFSTLYYHKSTNFSAVGTVTYIHPWSGSDSSKTVATDVEISKGVFKNKATIKGGYGYQKDYATQRRHIIRTGMSMTVLFGIQFDVLLERHFIAYQIPTGKNTDMHLGRLTLIKTF